jgi:hypothetical protein
MATQTISIEIDACELLVRKPLLQGVFSHGDPARCLGAPCSYGGRLAGGDAGVLGQGSGGSSQHATAMLLLDTSFLIEFEDELVNRENGPQQLS